MPEGSCHDAFSPVLDAFTANFTDRGELGAAVTVIVGGETVVDLWDGWADPDRTRRWSADTLVNAYSVGKAFVALLVLQLVEQGALDLDDPVARVWPDFGAHGKDHVTVREALCHRAGVPAIRTPLDDSILTDFDAMCAALADTAPWWPPGSRHSYHTNTYGHLAGGIVRHVTGDLPGTRLARVTAPIDADVHVGLPDAEHPRCADVVFRAPGPITIELDTPDLDADARMTLYGYANPPGYSSMGVVNSAAWRRAQVPSTNGHMTARGIARLYAAIARGDVIGSDLLAEATRAQSSGFCPTLGQEVTFGLGFQPWTEARPLGRNPGGFGHFGTGGSLGFADPDAEIAFGYVMNDVVPRWQSPRNRALVDAVYASL
jgi:CubicO group peptidase (beta-lactamase class C family)